MRIALRHLPFTSAQTDELIGMIHASGAEALCLPPDEAPDPALLSTCEALIGYYPVELLGHLPRLRWLQVPCAGVERYCAAVPEHVVLTNCSGAFGVAIAEYLLAGLLALYRHLPEYQAQQYEALWQPLAPCRTVNGSVVTVVGMGDIGWHFASLVKAMGAVVRGVRRTPRGAQEPFDEEYPAEQLAQAVRGADAVALCLPATAQTRGMISAEILQAMGPQAVVLNCGRGAVLDEAALDAALARGSLAGAVLDVACTEPLPASSPLWHRPNVIITPHISGRDGDGANTPRIYRIIAQNLRLFLSSSPLTHVVDKARGY